MNFIGYRSRLALIPPLFFHQSGFEMRRTVKGLLLASCALGLLACTPAAPSLERMQEAVDERLAETALPAAARPGTTAEPRSTLGKAVAENGEYLAALAAEREAIAGIAVAKSARRPQLTIGGTAGRIYEGSPSNDVISGAAADLMLSQIVFDGGATRAGIDQATAAAIGARAYARETGNRVAMSAYRAWVGLWLTQQQNRLLMTRTAELGVIEGQLDRMTDSGMIDSSLQERARLAQIDMELQRTRLEGDLLAAEAAFLRYFEVVPPAVGRPDGLLSQKERESASSDWQDAPSLRRLAAELLAAEAATVAAKAAFKPLVSLRTGVTSPMDPDDTSDTSVGLQLQYTLGDGGRRKARIAAAEARVEGLRAQLSSAKDEARSTLASSLAALAALDRSAALAAEKVAASATQVKTAEAQIALGQSTLAALLDAHIAHYRASEQELQITADRLILQAEIAAGTGRLMAKLGLVD